MVDNNPYAKTEKEKEFLRTIIELYETYPKHYAKMLLSKKNNEKYKEILAWVKGCVGDILVDTDDFKYSLNAKLNWIVHGKIPFPRCEHSGCNNLVGWHVNYRMADDIGRFCSSQCARKDESVIEKQRKTRTSKNVNGKWNSDESVMKGVATYKRHQEEDPEFSANIYKRSQKTRLERHGDPNWNNREKSNATYKRHCDEYPDFKFNQIKKCKATKKRNHGDENYVNSKKSIETHKRNNRGVYRTPEQQQQINLTFQKNHNGLTSTFQLPGVYEKCMQAFIKKFGVDSPLKSKEVQNKIIESWMKEYGVDHPWKDPEIRQKGIDKQIELYGTLSHTVKYMYDGVSFDSSWELALWIFCKDNKIKVEKTDDHFTYMCNSAAHLYFPDLKVNDEFVEIKGDQFFDRDGKMICPFRYDEWSDEKYAEVCAIYEAKHQCMLKNNVKIMRSRDIAPILEYIRNKYGSKYLKQFQVKSEAAK